MCEKIHPRGRGTKSQSLGATKYLTDTHRHTDNQSAATSKIVKSFWPWVCLV